MKKITFFLTVLALAFCLDANAVMPWYEFDRDTLDFGTQLFHNGDTALIDSAAVKFTTNAWAGLKSGRVIVKSVAENSILSLSLDTVDTVVNVNYKAIATGLYEERIVILDTSKVISADTMLVRLLVKDAPELKLMVSGATSKVAEFIDGQTGTYTDSIAFVNAIRIKGIDSTAVVIKSQTAHAVTCQINADLSVSGLVSVPRAVQMYHDTIVVGVDDTDTLNVTIYVDFGLNMALSKIVFAVNDYAFAERNLDGDKVITDTVEVGVTSVNILNPMVLTTATGDFDAKLNADSTALIVSYAKTVAGEFADTIIVASGVYADTLTVSVKIAEEAVDTTIYSWLETFGTSVSKTYGSKGTSWPFLDQYTDYDHAADCDYSGKNTSVRQPSGLTPSVWFPASKADTLRISNITVEGDKEVYLFIDVMAFEEASMGACNLSVSVNGVAVAMPATSVDTVFTTLNLGKLAKADTYELVITKLASNASAYRVDNILFTTDENGEGGDTPEPTPETDPDLNTSYSVCEAYNYYDYLSESGEDITVYLYSEDNESNDIQLDLIVAEGTGLGDGVLPVGTYTISDSGEEGTAFVGYEDTENDQYLGCVWYDYDEYVAYLIVSGTVEITKDGSNYTVTIAGETENGGQVNVTYTGAITIEEGQYTGIKDIELDENVYARDGRIYAEEGARIYTLTGLDVTRQNGNLNGVYVVCNDNKVAKVVVRK